MEYQKDDPIRMKLANILKNFHRNSPHPEADPGDIDSAIEAVLRAPFHDGEQVPAGATPPALFAKGSFLERDRLNRIMKAAPPISPTLVVGVDFAKYESASIEYMLITKERYDELTRRIEDLLEANNRYLYRARVAEARTELTNE